MRVSKDRESETSTLTQAQRIAAYCQAMGWVLVQTITEPGRSAYKASRSARPGFRKAREIIGAGAADTLIVWKIDRACRSTADTLDLVDELSAAGAGFVSVTESFDTSTPAGRLTMTVLAALAELESATKSERVSEWQHYRRSTGATPTGQRPFGYRRERNRLVVDESEAAIVREAAALVLDGGSLRGLAATMAERDIVGKNGRPLTNRGWRVILTSPTIAGCREVDDTLVPSDAWEPIIDVEQLLDLRSLLLDPQRRSTTARDRRWLLVGIARCGRCSDDTPMICRPHSVSPPRYVCPTCTLSIEAERTEKLVSDDLLDLLDVDAWRRLRAGVVEPADTAAYDDAMTELVDRFGAGEVDATTFADMAEGLRRQRNAATTERPALPDVDDVRRAWPTLDVNARRLVLSAATESLVIEAARRGLNRFDSERVRWTPR